MMSPVVFTITDNVGVVTLNRPTLLNAIDVELAQALVEAIAQAESSVNVRAVVLRGAGRAFCAGGDVSRFDGSVPHADVAERTINCFHPALLRLASTPKPTIAVVHGAVAGAGMSLLLACDFAIAAADARFTMAYPKIGATVDGGASWFLPRLVGLRKAKELAMLSETFDAATAFDLGLLTRVVEADRLDEVAASFSAHLANGPSAAYGEIKRLLCSADLRSLDAHLEEEKAGFLKAAAGEDFAEGLAAFRAKRPPVFKGRRQ